MNIQMHLEQERFDWAIRRLIAVKVRITEARERVLRCLAAQHLPITMEHICTEPAVQCPCDPATVWRALVLLEEQEIVRQVRFAGRCGYFVLNAPGHSCDYLVCRRCGIVADLPVLAPMADLERQLAVEHGFKISHHELEIYGTCADCRVPNSTPKHEEQNH
jgi:Fe2+ or Zn2+ uptake regulation protein